MSTFADELHRVRTERGYTQARIAEEMNVSRQTVSHWENQRAIPDIDTIKRLSQVLDHNFLMSFDIAENANGSETVIAEEDAEPAAAEAQSPAAEQAPAASSRSRRLLLIAAVVMLIVCALVAVFMLTRPELPKEIIQNPYTRFTYEWHRFQQEPIDGQAFIEVYSTEDPIYAIPDPGDTGGLDYWEYTFVFKNSSDIDFTIDMIYLQYYDSELNPLDHNFEFDGEYIAGIFDTNILHAGQSIEWVGGLIVQDCPAVGYTVEGTDANGNQLVFHGAADLDPQLKQQP